MSFLFQKIWQRVKNIQQLILGLKYVLPMMHFNCASLVGIDVALAEKHELSVKSYRWHRLRRWIAEPIVYLAFRDFHRRQEKIQTNVVPSSAVFNVPEITWMPKNVISVVHCLSMFCRRNPLYQFYDRKSHNSTHVLRSYSTLCDVYFSCIKLLWAQHNCKQSKFPRNKIITFSQMSPYCLKFHRNPFFFFYDNVLHLSFFTFLTGVTSLWKSLYIWSLFNLFYLCSI